MTNTPDLDQIERMQRANWKPAVTYWKDRADKAEAERDSLRDLMSRAHAVMRACGWQLAIASDPQGEGVLETACTEIEAEFADVLKGGAA